MKISTLAQLAEKINSEFAAKIPWIDCVADGGICDSLCLRLSFQNKEDWNYNIFQNSPYVIIQVFPNRRWEKDSDSEKYVAELSSWSFQLNSETGKPMRKKTGNLNKIFDHIQKFVLGLSVKES